MRYQVEQDGIVVEDFEAEGHRNTKKSAHLDALKVVAAWGYHNHEGYLLVAHDGEYIQIVDPYKSPKWQKVMHKDYLHIVGAS